MAPEAGDGTNFEGYGETYTRAIAKLLAGNRSITTGQFVDSVAQVAAHELGHMFGLRHTARRLTLIGAVPGCTHERAPPAA